MPPESDNARLTCVGFGYKPPLCGLLAQSVEQLTLNQLVVGSNPSRPTKYVFCVLVFSV